MSSAARAPTATRRSCSLLLEQLGRRRLLLPVPYAAWELLATLTSHLPVRPISRDQVMLMRQDNVVAPGARSFADLGIAPRAVEEILPGYLGIEPDVPAG